jgi:hypothetical protein
LLTDLTLRTILQCSQPDPDLLIEPGQSDPDLLVQRDQASHRAGDDSLGLGLHQLDVALPLHLLVVQRLRKCDPPRIKQNISAVVQLAR